MSQLLTSPVEDSKIRAKSGIVAPTSDPFSADIDQRVHLPLLGKEDNDAALSAAGLWHKVTDGLKGAQEKLQNIDRQELQEKGEKILRTYPWQSALVGFALGALVGRKIFQR